MTDLTERQKKFCRELLKGKSGTQAALSAGYSPTSAETHAHRMLKNDKVKQYLAQLSKQVEKESIMSGTQVLQMLTKIATKAPKSSDCLKALDLLGKHHKLFTEMHEHQHTYTLMPSIKIGGEPLGFDVGKPKPSR